MDEMMDNGIPMTTEPNVLKTMIVPPTIFGRVATSMGVGDKSNITSDLPEGMLTSIWWRKKGVKYTNNEIYLDIVEEIDCSIDTNGLMVTCDVSGEVQVNCKLSGMPDLTLSFTNPAIIDEVNFHPCVRLTRYERDRVMSFVPPDGKFKLASYSVSTTVSDRLTGGPVCSYWETRERFSCAASSFSLDVICVLILPFQ